MAKGRGRVVVRPPRFCGYLLAPDVAVGEASGVVELEGGSGRCVLCRCAIIELLGILRLLPCG